MTIYLVRHVKAGSRSDWDGDDRDRPVSNRGRKQAVALMDRLAVFQPPNLISSPFLRCVQTLEPLAARCAVEIESWEGLAEGAPFEPVLERIATLADHAVLCSHGDLIPDVVHALARRGAELVSEPNWKKGAVWVLERQAGEVTTLAAWPPPP